MNTLALTCQTLYDVQRLEDANTIHTLTVRNNEHRLEIEKYKMRSQYLQTIWYKDYFNWTEACEIYNTLANESIEEGVTWMEYILNACEVSYEIQTPPSGRLEKFPYKDCVDTEVDVVWDGTTLLLGKKFWNAQSLSDQASVYLLKYVLNALYIYLPNNDNMIYETEATVLLIIEACLVPYKLSNASIPPIPPYVNMLTFEEYMHADFNS